MSRLLVLVPAVLWFLWLDTAQPGSAQPLGLALFLGGLFVTVLSAAYAALRGARLDAGSFGGAKLAPAFEALHRLSLPALLAWFGMGLFVFGWGDAALSLTHMPQLPSLRTPGLALATLPIYGVWAFLLAAEYPAYRRRRESRALEDLDRGLPVYPPSRALRFWNLAVRTRLLFALIPLLLLMAVRDCAMVLMWALEMRLNTQTETWLFVLSALAVIAISPELVRRLLPTRSLDAGALRNRLETLCARTGLPMRDILVWDTGGGMVNAAVIGFLPRLRYVLLTDVLLDTMTPVQIEAVFGHEIGHVKHRHLLWYFVFLAGMTLFFAGPVEALWRAAAPETLLGSNLAEPVEVALGVASLLLVFSLFGLLSRCFERQADIFAARMVQAQVEEASAGGGTAPRSAPPAFAGPVGCAGADIFSSSLQQAARLNNLPVDIVRRGRGPMALLSRASDQLAHYFHGTIRSRIDYLDHLARRPTQAYRFDLTILAVKACVLVITAASAAFLMLG